MLAVVLLPVPVSGAQPAVWASPLENTYDQIHKCKDDLGCSFNGKCHTGICMCDTAWQGMRCEVLAFEPAVRKARLHTVENDGHTTATWVRMQTCVWMST